MKLRLLLHLVQLASCIWSTRDLLRHWDAYLDTTTGYAGAMILGVRILLMLAACGALIVLVRKGLPGSPRIRDLSLF